MGIDSIKYEDKTKHRSTEDPGSGCHECTNSTHHMSTTGWKHVRERGNNNQKTLANYVRGVSQHLDEGWEGWVRGNFISKLSH